MKNKYILILLLICFSLALSGCNKTNVVDINIDQELSSIPNDENYYPQEILDPKVQEQIINEQVNNEDILIDHTLLNYADATNKMPIKDMLYYSKSYFEDKGLDWFGVEWAVTPYENMEGMLSDIKLTVAYDINDLEFAKRKTRELSDKYLKTFGNIIYKDNIYETDFKNLENSVIRIIADVKDEDLYAVLNIGIFNNTFDNIKIPYTEIVFVHKNNIHNIDDYGVSEIIDYMDICLKSSNIKPMFKTIKLDPYNGYIIDEPKSEKDITPEEDLNSSVIFFK